MQHIQNGNAAPTTAPPRLGKHYVDETGRVLYLAVGTNAIADWARLVTEDNSNLRVRNGKIEIKNETDGLWYQVRCRNNADGKSELFQSDSGAA